MPINASPEYYQAEKKYLNAQSQEDKIYWLEEMIRKAPHHKSSENFLAELKRRLKKLREKAEKATKKAKGKKGIKKEGFQFVLVGLPNTGKSSLLDKLTNAKPRITEYPFSTSQPEIGAFNYQGVKAQIIDTPPIGSENFDIGIVNMADCLILVIENLDELEEIEKYLLKAKGKRIVVVNKADKLGINELRKLNDKIKSRKINGAIVSCHTDLGIDELENKLIDIMEVIRIFTKEPGKEKSKEPMVLPEGSTIRDVAEHILKGFSLKVKETRLTGPSGKFPNQKVGLNHELRDLDIVEFHTR